MNERENFNWKTLGEIPINGDDISDVITYNGWYKNLMTGVKGRKLGDVLRDRRFILKKHMFSREELRGYYVWTNEAGTAMVVFMATFNFKEACWEKDSYCTFTDDGEVKNHISIAYCIDICGQSCNNHVYSVLGKQRASRFIGRIYRIYNKNEYDVSSMPHICDSIEEFISLRNYLFSKKDAAMLSSSKEDFDLNSFVFKDGERKMQPLLSLISMAEKPEIPYDLPIPKGAEVAIEKYKELCISQIKYEPVSPQHFAILQVIDGNLIQREFAVDVNVVYPAEDSTADILEYRRTLIDRKYDLFPRELVIYSDELSGTVFEYVKKPLNELLKRKQVVFNNSTKALIPKLYALGEFMEDRYGVSENDILSVMFLLSSKWIERLTKIYNNNEFLSLVHHCAIHFRGIGERPVDCIERDVYAYLFGSINMDAKNINDFLQAPNELLKLCMDKSPYYSGNRMFKDIKYMFKTKEATDYLIRMNKDDVAFLADKMYSLDKTLPCGRLYRATKVLGFMIKNYGAKNFKEYIGYVETHIPLLKDYCRYITAMNTIETNSMISKDVYKKTIKKNGWKMNDDALTKAYAFACTIEELGENLDVIEKSFDEKQEEWNSYCFEHKNLMVVAPRRPEDVVMEGLVLNHCAKSFVTKVAKGETTLLFIRNKKSADQPLFTLELRDKAVRQAHGFNNCNVDANEEVEEFLKSFCKNFSISLDIRKISKAYGV